MKNSVSKRRIIRTALHCLLIMALSLLVITRASAQGTADGQTPLGIAPGAPAGSYSLSDFDNVNLFNGNLNFRLPLVNILGRGGAGYSSLLTIERKWTVVQDFNDQTHQTTYLPLPVSWEGIKPGYGPGVLQGRRGGIGNVAACSARLYTQTLTRLTFTAPDGTEFELHDQLTDGQPRNPVQCAGAGFSRGKIFITDDGTAATFISDTDILDGYHVIEETPFYPSGYLLMHDGIRYRINEGLVSWQRDRNGNQLSFTYNSNKILTSVTDSLNRTVTFNYGVPDSSPYGLCNQITFKGFGGTARTVKISIAQLGSTTTLGPVLRAGYTIQTEQQLFPELNGSRSTVSFNPDVVSALWLPDSDGVLRHYKFSYNSYGELARVDLPTGGAIEYDYATGLTDGNPSGVISNIPARRAIYRRVVERRVYADGVNLESKMTYSRPESTTDNLGHVRTEQYDGSGALLGRQEHYFYGGARPSFGSSSISYPAWQDGREYQTDVFDSDGTTLLRRTINTWQQPTAGNSWPLTPAESNSLVKPNNPQITETITTLADTTPNLVAKQTFDYDKYGNRTDVYEYDYGQNAAGALARRTHINYLTTNPANGVAYDTLNPNSNNPDLPTTVHIRNLPVQSSVFDAAGVERARVSFEYDKYIGDSNHVGLVACPNISALDSGFTASYQSRGNVTATTSYLLSTSGNITGSISAYAQYDVAGNVLKSIDALGHITAISYTDQFSSSTDLGSLKSYAFPTGRTNALNQSTSAQYDYYTGHPVSGTDSNGVATNLEYNDVLDRQTKVVRAVGTPAQNQTLVSYDDTNHIVTTTSDLDVNKVLKSIVLYDGLGRTTETRHYESSSTFITSKQEYDALGRVKRSYNPYRTTADETYGWADITYDALSQTTRIETFNASSTSTGTVTTAYSGNRVTSTDQAGKKRRSVMDALGHLVEVDEPDATTGNLDGQNGTPVQPTIYGYDALDNLKTVAQGGQTRSFNYDSLKRLTSANNPESGTVSYDYDNNGNLLHRTDARNITMTCAYDELNRITSRSYSDATPAVTYSYDTAGIANAKGQLTSISSSISKTSYAGFDALGRITASSQQTNGQTYSMSYEYDLAGNLKSEMYPSGRSIHHTFDGAGRLQQVAGTKGSAGTTYVLGLDYTAHGAVRQLTLGNGLVEQTTFNSRLQPMQIKLGTPASATDKLSLQYDYGMTNNNGNVLNQTITFPGLSQPIIQTYEYDSLNRLSLARETNNGAQSWQQVYSHDRYGNRRFKAGTSLPASQDIEHDPALNPTINPANNRIDPGQGYGYDNGVSNSVGNLTSAPGYTYTFDAENRVATSNSSPNQQPNANSYAYDGEGRRVKSVTANGEELSVFVYNAWGQMVAEYNGLTPASTSETSYVTSDTLGTPRVLTKADGVVKSRHDYLPFGEELNNSIGGRNTVPEYAVADRVKQKFTQKERDVETGLDHFGARYYSGTQGRFTSSDPLLSSGIVNSPQSWNRYSYTLNNPLKYTDPNGLYVFDPNATQRQRRQFEEGLRRLARSRDSFMVGSYEYNRLDRAIKAYGAAGVDNGVTIRFGATGNGGAADTSIGIRDRNGDGVKDVTADNPTGQDTIVTFDEAQNDGANGYALNIGHEGSHVADGADLVGAIPNDLTTAAAQAILNGPLNLTQYRTETSAYEVSTIVAQGLHNARYGIDSLMVGGNRIEIWNSGWHQADLATRRGAGIDRILAQRRSEGGLYEVTPANQGRRLIQ